MTAPATEWLRPIWPQVGQAASDRPDFNSDTWAILLFADTFDATAYDPDTTGAYGTAPFTSSNDEVSGTGYTQGTGFAIGSVAMGVDTSNGAVYVTGDDVVIGAGVTLAEEFRMGLVVDRTTTTKWGLTVVNFGADWPVVDPAIVTIEWPDTPHAGCLFHFM
jgi:hypothetical protein